MTHTRVTSSITRRGFLSATAVATVGTSARGRQISKDPGEDESWIPSADRLASLEALMRLAAVPGLAIAVVEGHTIWSRVFGVTNADTNEAVGAQTLFEAASISKPVFAYGVLQLVAEGRLNLDTPLADIFRPSYFPPDEFIDRITARHVLTHTSGLPNWGDDKTPATMSPAFPPGRYFRYSGEGLFWLQLVVETITEQGLDAFLRERLFDPAGMTSSMFTWDEAHLPDVSFGHRDGRVVAAHGMRPVMGLIGPRARAWKKPLRDWTHHDFLRAGAELQPSSPPARVRFQNAAGSLLTTAVDYARFLTLMCDRPSPAPWELPQALRRLMVTPAVSVQDEGGLSWSLGWAIEHSRGRRYYVHEGNNDNAFASCAIGDPVAGRGLVILTNAGSGSPLARRLVEQTTGISPVVFIAHLDPRRGG